MPKGIVSASFTIDVPFFDVDVMRIVWHGHYVKYFEMARCELLNKIDYNYNQMEISGVAWPVTDIRLQYVNSAQFGQKIEVTATLVEYDMRLKINYEIRDIISGKRLTKGYTVQVAVDIETKELQFETPQILLDKLEDYIPVNNNDQ